jgi:hypothetical protein
MLTGMVPLPQQARLEVSKPIESLNACTSELQKVGKPLIQRSSDGVGREKWSNIPANSDLIKEFAPNADAASAGTLSDVKDISQGSSKLTKGI